MSRVLALVEGATEQTFVRDLLAPYLSLQGVHVTAAIRGKPGHKGGIRRWASITRELTAALKQDSGRFLTTMFDFYGLPSDWPALGEARRASRQVAPTIIEDAMFEDLSRSRGESFDQRRFIPYIQMHEFEALLFVEPTALSQVVRQPVLAVEMNTILQSFHSPEDIDDGNTTAPSKRILRLVPHYQKLTHGAMALERVGLARLRGSCRHLNDWVCRLEKLSG